MHGLIHLLKSLLDDVDNRMELYLHHKNYFHHRSLCLSHLKRILVHLQGLFLPWDLLCMHHKVHGQYVIQQDEHGNDIDVSLQAQQKIHR